MAGFSDEGFLDDTDFWGDDGDCAPFADPQIRLDYEAALGRLILAHNEVDFRLAKALERVVLRIAPDRSMMHYARGTFENRLRNLDLFQKAVPESGVVKIDVAALRRLNAIRNDVAHGHFDQNPFDGSYTLIGDGKGTGKKPMEYSVAELGAACEALKSIASTLNAHEIFGDFRPEPLLPAGARPA
jgi:hypothetical protein